jgi:hypothetical protein
MIEMFPEERWPELTEIFVREFNSTLPHKGRAYILADVVEGEIKAFVVVEMLLRVGQVYSTGGSARRLLKQVEDNMPPNTAVIAIASEPRYESLFEKFKMYKFEGALYRRDF